MADGSAFDRCSKTGATHLTGSFIETVENPLFIWLVFSLILNAICFLVYLAHQRHSCHRCEETDSSYRRPTGRDSYD